MEFNLEFFTPLQGFFLAALESLIPPLPLTAIVGLNVLNFGAWPGFLVSWTGTCLGSTAAFLFFRFLGNTRPVRRFLGGEKISEAVRFVSGINAKTLFLLIMLPFTPSSFVNFSFGITKYGKAKFIRVLLPAKAVMTGSLTLVGSSFAGMTENPLWGAAAILLLILLYAASRELKKKHRL